MAVEEVNNKNAKANEKRTRGVKSAFVEIQLEGRTTLVLNTPKAHEKFVVIAGSAPPKTN